MPRSSWRELWCLAPLLWKELHASRVPGAGEWRIPRRQTPLQAPAQERQQLELEEVAQWTLELMAPQHSQVGLMAASKAWQRASQRVAQQAAPQEAQRAVLRAAPAAAPEAVLNSRTGSCHFWKEWVHRTDPETA